MDTGQDKVKVNVKWGKELFEDVEVDLTQPPSAFKRTIENLSSVPVERMKILGLKGGMLKDNADWSRTGIVNGKTIMLMGTAREVIESGEKVAKMAAIDHNTQGDRPEVPEEERMPIGLVNVGNTCYANSTIQMVAAIRELAPLLSDAKAMGNVAANTLLPTVAAFANIVSDLRKTDAPVNPEKFMILFRHLYSQFDERDERTGLHKQQDSDEFLTSLISLLDNSVDSERLRKLIEIRFRKVAKCVETEEETVDVESVLKLECHIDETVSNLSSGIKTMFSGSISKNSAVLGRNSEFVIESEIVDPLPRYIFVQFVRFFWKKGKDGEDGRRAKILRVVKFPNVLDIGDFASEELSQRFRKRRREINEASEQRRQRMQAGEEVPEDLEGEVAMELDGEESLGKTCGKYDLLSVLSHQGRSSASGHYVTWGRRDVNSKEWYKYDDDKVSLVREEDIHSLAGGADNHIAYICLYKHRFE